VLTHTEPIAKIDDYGLIGDCRSAALVSKYGSIDWLCWPQFDSPSIFAAILDTDRGGHWSVTPAGPFEAEHSYIPNTNVLEARFACSGGRATLTDLMPVCSEEVKREALFPDHQIIREIRCTGGQVQMQTDFHPRSEYGLDPVRIRELGSLGLRMDVGRGAYWLRSTIPLTVSEDSATASFSLKQGEVAQFALTYAQESPSVLPAFGDTMRGAIKCSIAWWQKWAAQSRYNGPYRDAVTRSALVLKLLTYAPSGAVVAAPTTSLPERIGDSLNWDYRFCWLRDASLTIRAMLGLGYFDEAEGFLNWLLTATRLTQPELCVLYTVFGRIARKEQELERLRGYFDSRPVRVGNAAQEQMQLDIYGEVIEATAQYAQHLTRFDRTTQKALIGFGEYVARNWDRPDEGIWEPRFGRANHTHSRLMCWTALDRLLALSEKDLLQGVPQERFTRERDRIREQIESRAWNEALESYVAVLDGDEMDATLLRVSWYGFEHADSKRMKSTYRRVVERLGAGNGLLYRYERNPVEGAFGVCGFWGVEHLAVGGGTLDEAHDSLQQLLKYQSGLGLFAEETDPASGRALGNFPQAFTHVGLISAALTLAEQERGKEQPAIRVGSDVKASPAGARS
jgi:GH15 family glucan-1,4-alpha-glucosidase